MDSDEREPDRLGRLILDGMRDYRVEGSDRAGLSYQGLADLVGVSKSWLHRLIHGRVKLAHGDARENRARLARIVALLGLDEAKVDAAAADRHFTWKPTKHPDYDFVESLGGELKAVVRHYSRMTPEQKAVFWKMAVEDTDPGSAAGGSDSYPDG